MSKNKKYRLDLEDTIKVGAITLYRIVALRDFGNVSKGDRGGYIQKECNLSHYGTARVYGTAWIYGTARVYDNVETTSKVFNLNYDTYNITITDEHMQIGCKRFKIDEWFNFSSETISQMDKGALEWWTKWKPILQSIIEIKRKNDES